MNIEVRQPERGAKEFAKEFVKTRVGIFDCDIHPKSSLEDLQPYLSNRWWDYLQTYGQRQRHGYVKGFPYPKSQPLASRRDSWPPGGGLPASDLDFMREQHLDFYGIEWGIMNPLSPTGQAERRAQRRHGIRRQRVPARRLEPARSAPQGVRGHSLREQRIVMRRDSQTRR